MRRSTALFFRTACVEVERKFRPPPSAFALLSASASATPTEPPLSSTRAPSETVPAAAKTEDTWLHDLYLDAADFRLSCADHWLRRRGRSFSAASVASSADTLGGVQHWELKRPAAALSAAALASLGSNAAHGKPAVDHYEELEGDALARALNLPDASPAAFEKAGLRPFGLIITRRRSAYGELYPDVKLDLDEIWFAASDVEVLSAGWDSDGMPRFVADRKADYVVAEAEVMIDAGAESQEALQAARATAEARVMGFIQKELGAKLAGVRGKILEYLFQCRPEHYARLVDTGLLKSKLGA